MSNLKINLVLDELRAKLPPNYELQIYITEDGWNFCLLNETEGLFEDCQEIEDVMRKIDYYSSWIE